MTNKHLLYLSCLTFLGGMLIYNWYTYWPVTPMPLHDTLGTHSTSKTVRITYWSHSEWKHEEQTVVWSSSPADRITQIVQAWLSIVDEEGLLPHTCSLSSVTLSASGLEAFISFDHSPLSAHHGTYTNWMLIESLLASLRENQIDVQHLRFLECHQPLQDNHLDFSKPWPLSGFLHTFERAEELRTSHNIRECTIVIDPAGDASNPGRIIDDTFERGITLQYAQALSKALQEKLPYALITVARLPGEAVEPLRNAIVANRLQADLYININFYAEKEQIPTCLISFMSWNPFHETITPSSTQPLSFVPYHEAYRPYIKKSYTAASVCKEILQQQLPTYTPILAGIPCKALLGISVPAISIEFGLYTKHGWQALVQPTMQALLPAISALLADKHF